MIFPWFGNGCDLRLIPAARVRARAQDQIEESEQHIMESRSGAFEKQIMDSIRPARLIILQVPDYARELVLLNSMALKVRRRLAQQLVRCGLVRDSESAYGFFHFGMVCQMFVGEQWLWWCDEDLVDHFRFCRVIGDRLSRIRGICECRDCISIPEFLRIAQAVELACADATV